MNVTTTTTTVNQVTGATLIARTPGPFTNAEVAEVTVQGDLAGYGIDPASGRRTARVVIASGIHAGTERTVALDACWIDLHISRWVPTSN